MTGRTKLIQSETRFSQSDCWNIGIGSEINLPAFDLWKLREQTFAVIHKYEFMWVKKTEEELYSEKKTRLGFWGKIKRNDKSPIQLSVISFILFFLIIMFIEMFAGVPQPRYPFGPGGFDERISFSEIHYSVGQNLLTSLFFAIFIFIVVYPWGKKRIIKVDDHTFVCDKCNMMKGNEINNICECGGTYYYIKLMKWIEDD